LLKQKQSYINNLFLIQFGEVIMAKPKKETKTVAKNTEVETTAKNEVAEVQTATNAEILKTYGVKTIQERFNTRFPVEQYSELHSECENIFSLIPKMQEWGVHLSIDLMHFVKFAVVKTADFKRVHELSAYTQMPNFEVFGTEDMETTDLQLLALRGVYLKLKKSIDSYTPNADGSISIVQEAFINKCSVQLKNTLHYTLLANTLPFFKQMNSLFKYKVYNIMQIARDWTLLQEYLSEKYAETPLVVSAIGKTDFRLCHALINSDAFNCNTSKRAVYIAQINGASTKRLENEGLFQYIQRYFNENWKINNVSEMLLCSIENAVIGKVAAGNRNELLLLSSNS
jgi:hypothetical protein